MRKFLSFVFFICSLQASKAQCRQWFGESYDSVPSIIYMVERYTQFKLQPSENNSNKSTTLWFYDTLSGSQNHLVTVEIKFDFERKLNGTHYDSIPLGIHSIKINAPGERLIALGKAIEQTINNCIIQSAKTYVLFGKRDKPHRLLINAYPGEIDLLRN